MTDLVRSKIAELWLGLRERFARAVNEGDLPDGSNPADLARYVSAIVQGMAVQAASGATRAELRKLADIAMRTWPPA